MCRNLLEFNQKRLVNARKLGFSKVKISFLVPDGMNLEAPKDNSGIKGIMTLKEAEKNIHKISEAGLSFIVTD